MDLHFFGKKPVAAFAGQEPQDNGAWAPGGAGQALVDTTGPAHGDQAGAQGHLPWGEQLLLVSQQLRQLSASSEGEFLSIGEHLQGFYQRATTITTTVTTLVDQLGGEESKRAMQGLGGMVALLQENLEQGAQSQGLEALTTILDRLHQVTAPLTGFGQMNKMLGMFGMYTKIESAQLGTRAAGFQSLAVGVTKLSAEVGSKADTVLRRKDELASVIQEALATAVGMGAEQRAKTLALLDKTRQSLELLTSIVARCAHSTGMISTTAQEVTADLGEVVVSLQTHDTVRQQIEHVVEALDELTPRMPGQGVLSRQGPAVRGELLVETGALCQIQAEQLRHAATELMNAVESIVAHLRDIANKESAMANGTGELVGVTDQAGSSFFTELGRDLAEVMAQLAATVATNRQLSAVMTRAAETVGGIFRFVDDIETIAYDIKLMALNFLIQASALGQEGLGLGVLADAIKRLSEEARRQAAGVTGILTEVKAVTDGMCRDAVADSLGVETKISTMRQGVEEMLSALTEMSGGVGQGLTLANAMARELSADIEQLTAGITVHRRLSASLAESGTTLEGMAQEAKAMTTEAEWLTATERLRAADNRYTMHSERNIHAAVVNRLSGADNEAPPALALVAGGAPPSPGGDGEDLGDNVELF